MAMATDQAAPFDLRSDQVEISSDIVTPERFIQFLFSHLAILTVRTRNSDQSCLWTTVRTGDKPIILSKGQFTAILTILIRISQNFFFAPPPATTTKYWF